MSSTSPRSTTSNGTSCGWADPSKPGDVPGLPDLLAPNLDILFIGINPGLKSARVGHYYAGPGNLFWRCLYESGLTPVPLTWSEDRRLLEFGIGLVDCVARPTRSARDLRPRDFAAAAPALREKIERFAPRIVCFNGLTGYRGCFDSRATLGRQPEPIGSSVVFIVPSTSAANAGFRREERVAWFRRLRDLRDELLGCG